MHGIRTYLPTPRYTEANRVVGIPSTGYGTRERLTSPPLGPIMAISTLQCFQRACDALPSYEAVTTTCSLYDGKKDQQANSFEICV